MKVRATFHIQQTVGSLQVERVAGTVFDLPDAEATAAIAAGIVTAALGATPTLKVTPTKGKVSVAANRETK
jgi:hypothetical protein